jgi:hypothetical protein
MMPTAMKNSDRGIFDPGTTRTENVIIRWHGNSPVVSIQSNSKLPRGGVQQPRKIEVSQPAAIKHYNRHMRCIQSARTRMSCATELASRPRSGDCQFFTAKCILPLQRSAGYRNSRLALLGFKRDIVVSTPNVFLATQLLGGPAGKVADFGKTVKGDVRYDGPCHLLTYRVGQKNGANAVFLLVSFKRSGQIQ